MSEKSVKTKPVFRIHLVILAIEVILPFLLYLAMMTGNTVLSITLSTILAVGILSLVFIP
ncbi:MAG: hypothetical protein AB2L21_02425 [Anaerolineaceae bacterium]